MKPGRIDFFGAVRDGGARLQHGRDRSVAEQYVGSLWAAFWEDDGTAADNSILGHSFSLFLV
jgi:hypothetical protein